KKACDGTIKELYSVVISDERVGVGKAPIRSHYTTTKSCKQLDALKK
ncbi:43971_t:CDS:1, partial [Gigaspora margarita]